MVSTVRLTSALFAGVLSLAACSSSTTTAAISTSSSSATSSSSTTPSATSPASTSATTPSTGSSDGGSASADCSKAQNAVEAMASVMPQGSMVKKVSLSADCKTMTVWTALTAAQAAVAQAICSQIDSPAYAGGAESVAIATADGKVVLAKGSKGQACAVTL